MAGLVTAQINHKFFDEMRNKIEKGDITEVPPKWAPNGIEQNSHITIFYGIPDKISLKKKRPVKKFIEFFKTMSYAAFKPHEVIIFDADEYDILVVVGREEGNQSLKLLHSLFKKAFDYEFSFPKYTPHITIGYVKKGLGKKYQEMFNNEYREKMQEPLFAFSIKEVTVSDNENNEIVCKLNEE